jgi:hypothetical protein
LRKSRILQDFEYYLGNNIYACPKVREGMLEVAIVD